MKDFTRRDLLLESINVMEQGFHQCYNSTDYFPGAEETFVQVLNLLVEDLEVEGCCALTFNGLSMKQHLDDYLVNYR